MNLRAFGHSYVAVSTVAAHGLILNEAHGLFGIEFYITGLVIASLTLIGFVTVLLGDDDV